MQGQWGTSDEAGYKAARQYGNPQSANKWTMNEWMNEVYSQVCGQEATLARGLCFAPWVWGMFYSQQPLMAHLKGGSTGFARRQIFQWHLAWLCCIVSSHPHYICLLFIKFPVWILVSEFLMSTTAFITDNNFLLQKGCIILHAFQITFCEQTLEYSIWQYGQLNVFIVI